MTPANAEKAVTSIQPWQEWTAAGEGPRLDKGLNEANKRGWLLVSMTEDRKTIFFSDVSVTSLSYKYCGPTGV